MTPDTVFSVTPDVDKAQFDPEIAALANGGFVVAYASDEGPPGVTPLNIFLQRYDYLGVAAGDGVQANTTTGNSHTEAAVTGLRGGGFVVAWEARDQDADDRGTYGRAYDALGRPVGGEIMLHTREQSFQAAPELTALANGGFVATWTSDGVDGDSVGIAAQRFTANGTRIGTEFVVNSVVENGQAYSDIAALENGGFVVVWHGRRPGTTDLLDIHAQRFADNGTRLGGEMTIGAVEGTYTGYPAVAGLESGGFAVTWRERDTFGPDDRIRAQDFDANGAPLRPAFQVNTYEDRGQYNPRIAGLEDGGFIITWDGFGADEAPRTGIWAQQFGADGARVGGQFSVDEHDNEFAFGSYSEATVTGLSDGGYAIAFTQEIAGTTEGLDIAARFSQGTQGVNETGGPAGDLMSGGRFGDNLNGAGGNDRLIGREGADTLSGGNGSDTLDGGAGNDVLTGGSSVNDLRDVIFGGDGNDSIDGGYGNDELRGDAGNDNIAGGFGADTVIGGAGDDTLTGSAFGDLMFGGDGDDFINGGFGSDRVNGGAGADQFFHLGIRDHGSDWIQDFNGAEDVLFFGDNTATRDQFQINRATTATAGADDVQEAFIIYRPTGQIMWALVDGDAQDDVNLRIGTQTFDLTEPI